MRKIRKCNNTDEKGLLDFLNSKPVYHTFIIADIKQYGFDQEFQDVYVQEEEEKIQGVFLRYFNNFIVAGNGEELLYDEIAGLVDSSVTTIMGCADIVDGISEKLSCKVNVIYNNLYTHEDPVDSHWKEGCTYAGLEDVDRIHQFLMSFPEFATMYAEKGMIVNRLQNKEGVHLFIEKDGKIIAHGNSAASADKTCMMGGISVEEGLRGQGYGKKILLSLCSEILDSGKIPCIFASEKADYSCFRETGFKVYGRWGVAQLKQEI